MNIHVFVSVAAFIAGYSAWLVGIAASSGATAATATISACTAGERPR